MWAVNGLSIVCWDGEQNENHELLESEDKTETERLKNAQIWKYSGNASNQPGTSSRAQNYSPGQSRSDIVQNMMPQSHTPETQQSSRQLPKRYDQHGEANNNTETDRYSGDEMAIHGYRSGRNTTRVVNTEDISKSEGQNLKHRNSTLEMQRSPKLLSRRFASAQSEERKEQNYFHEMMPLPSIKQASIRMAPKLPPVMKNGKSTSSCLRKDIAKLANDMAKVL